MTVAVGAGVFVDGLEGCGFSVTLQSGYAMFDFVVPIGSLIDQKIRLALFVPSDFPLTPPPGPHVSPCIGHPQGATHASDLGPEWEYWSRPFQHWANTDRTVRTYMGHIRQLFAQR
jgi:hypothetical protein